MKADKRHKHNLADARFALTTVLDPQTNRPTLKRWDEEVPMALLMDIRDTLQDMRDEMQETNRILRVTFGVEERKD